MPEHDRSVKLCDMVLTSVLALGVMLAPQANYAPAGPKLEFRLESGGSFIITTDPKASPKTVAHIVGLVKKGFYNKQRFHRVEDWVTQWGAPQSRDQDLGSEAVGNGGSGKDIPFEESKVSFKRGVVGIASTGMKVGGDSQIFILKSDATRLDTNYAVLGLVTKGMDLVDKIKRGDRIRQVRVVPGRG